MKDACAIVSAHGLLPSALRVVLRLRAALVAADLALESHGADAHDPDRKAISRALGFEPAEEPRKEER